MKRKIIITFMMFCTAFAICGCSGSGNSSEPSQSNSESENKEVVILSDAEVTLPAVMVGDEIPNDAVANYSENREKVTYSLSGAELTDIVNGIASDISESIDTILNDKDYYPNIQNIIPNSDYTEFTIELTGGELNTYEAMLVMSFYTIGDKYQLYYGIPEDKVNTIVKYVNGQTGEVINESSSKSMVTE